MLKHVGQITRPYLRKLYHQAHTAPRSGRTTAAVVIFSSGIAVGSCLWHTSSQKIYNDTDPSSGSSAVTPFRISNKHASPEAEIWRNQDTLHALVWGSNRCMPGFMCEKYPTLISCKLNIAKPSDTRTYDFRCGYARKREGKDYSVSNYRVMVGRYCIERYAVTQATLGLC